MCRYLPPSAVNYPVGLGDYTRAMMIKSILTICAAVVAGAAGTSLALAQGYPVPPGAVYSTVPQPYPPGGYPSDYRRAPGAPDLDGLDNDDDEAPNAQNSTALPPPLGPVLSPDDPRYGRPMGAPPYIPTAVRPPGPCFRPTIRAMAAPIDRRR